MNAMQGRTGPSCAVVILACLGGLLLGLRGDHGSSWLSAAAYGLLGLAGFLLVLPGIMSILSGTRWFHALLRYFYRIVDPQHPRGWLEIHAVFEREDEQTYWVHCHGMERWGLANIELVGVPVDLGGYAHGLLYEIVGYMKKVKPIAADETFGGQFISEGQHALHLASMRAAPDGHSASHDGRFQVPAGYDLGGTCSFVEREDQAFRRRAGLSPGLLRVVDLDEPAASGFAPRLFAAHLCALAIETGNPVEREQLCRRATEVFSGSLDAPPAAAFKKGDNENNFVAWEILGDALFDQGRDAEGLECLEEAVARCPAWAGEYRGAVLTAFADQPEAREKDPRVRFWNELDVDSVRKKVSARRQTSSR
jgi:hypothetical protein